MREVCTKSVPNCTRPNFVQGIKGKCELEIFLGGVSVVHPVLVAADLMQDCLLEIDFLGKHNCTIDLNGKSIKIDKVVVGLKGKNLLSSFFK